MFIRSLIVCFMCGLCALIVRPVLANSFQPHTRYEACFSPSQDCAGRLIALVNKAQHSIHMQAYSFSLRSLGHALLQAKRRGVRIKIIVDRGQLKPQARSEIFYLMQHGIPVWQDNIINLAHNKVMIFDGKIVETGSFNYTYSAQRYNAENILIIYSKALAGQYLQNWQQRFKHSVAVKLPHAK